MKGELTEPDEIKEFLTLGPTYYGTEGTNSFYYFHKEINPNKQVTIDRYIRELAEKALKAVIPGLPKTTLTEYEVNKVSKIMQFKLCCDLWQRKIAGEKITDAGNKKEIAIVGK